MTLIIDQWPLCRPSQVYVKDSKHPVAILTCWTVKERMIEKLKQAGLEYNSVGQLYSEQGLSPLFRNLLANRYIRAIVICGKDIGGASKKLLEIARKPSLIREIKALSDVPPEILEALASRLIIVEYDDISEKNLHSITKTAEAVIPYQQGQLSYPEPKPDTKCFPSHTFGHTVSGETIPETYLKMLDYILRFGVHTDTHYDDPQKEVLALQCVITNQSTVWNVEKGKLFTAIPYWMPESREHLEEYISTKILSSRHYTGLKYTYGELIHAFPAREVQHDEPFVVNRSGIDQFELAADKMAHNVNQRSCVISLWDPRKHTAQISGTPCLNHIQFRVRNGKLHMHALIRSNDMFAGWPENAYAMRALQEWFVYDVNEMWRLGLALDDYEDLIVGDLCITSISAHLYMNTWETARELVENHLWRYAKPPWKDWDPKGQFEVFGRDGKIVAILTNRRDALQEFVGSSARELCNKVAKAGATTNISNAMYLAREAMKVEYNLQDSGK